MNNQIERADHSHETLDEHAEGYDYARVNAVARIALYDDLRSAPRVTEIQPAPTGEFIENLASKVYEQAKTSGGTIPYTVIREVSENFIHARFAEVTVSILDDGNTIRFADQGPGIPQKEKAQLPGFTSAIEPMKRYIRGVGSGLPIVKEYLEFSHGTISIEDNLGTGSVVTISLKEAPGATEFAPANELGRTESAPSETTVPLAAALAPSAQTGLPAVGGGPGGMPAAGTPQYQAGGVQPLPAGPFAVRPRVPSGVPAAATVPPVPAAGSSPALPAGLPLPCAASPRAPRPARRSVSPDPACDCPARSALVQPRAGIPADLPQRRGPRRYRPGEPHRRPPVEHPRHAHKTRTGGPHREDGRSEAHPDGAGIPGGEFALMDIQSSRSERFETARRKARTDAR